MERFCFETVRIPGDDCWPLKEIESRPRDPSTPETNPYQRLKDRLFRAVAASGTRVLLTGTAGDHLYTGSERWLLSLLSERGLGAAVREVLGALGRRGLAALCGDPGVRNAGGRLVRALPGGNALLSRRRGAAHPWLTPRAISLLPEGGRPRGDSSLPRHLAPVWRRAARGASGAAHLASRSGIEIREPYRDRRVIDFVLSIPEHQLRRMARSKHVLRNAMADLLPEAIRDRRFPTSLFPLYNRGVLERERARVRALLDAPGALWPDYVRPASLSEALDEILPGEIDGARALLPWQCISMELWRRSPFAQERSRETPP